MKVGRQEGRKVRTYLHTYIPTYIPTHITLHYIPFHLITLHTYILTLHNITLQFITLHYITYIHIQRLPCTNAASYSTSRFYHLPPHPDRSCLSANEQGQWAEVPRDGFVQIHLTSWRTGTTGTTVLKRKHTWQVDPELYTPLSQILFQFLH